MKDREIDTMNTSFIDLICCALGSMLMLMLFVACLVQANGRKASQSAAAAPQEKSGLDGYETAPPNAMIVTVSCEGVAKYPIRLEASPPRREGATLTDQSDAKLTEETGFVRVIGTAGSDSYFGFYERPASTGGRKHELKLIIPRGRFGPHWRFQVTHPDKPPDAGRNDALAELVAAADCSKDFAIALVFGSRSWTGSTPRPSVELTNNASETIPLANLNVTIDAAYPPKPIEAEQLWPRIAVAAKLPDFEKPDQKDSLVISFYEKKLGQLIEWGVCGIGSTVVKVTPDSGSGKNNPMNQRQIERRNAELAKIWRDVILPELALATSQSREFFASEAARKNDPELEKKELNLRRKFLHKEALRVRTALARALKAAKPDARLDWQHLTGKPIELAVPGSTDYLLHVLEYAQRFDGSDFEKWEPLKVTLRVEEYPKPPVDWKILGNRERLLDSGQSAIFVAP